MRRSLYGLLFVSLALAWGCSKEEVSDVAESAKDAVTSAAETTAEAASDAMDSAQEAASEAMDAASGAMDSAKEAASGAIESAKEAATGAADAMSGALSGDTTPADACRSLSAKAAWEEALEICKEALAMSPDDLELQRAVQDAEAAAAE